MAETDVNPELVKKIVKQVLAQSANGGDSTKKFLLLVSEKMKNLTLKNGLRTIPK